MQRASVLAVLAFALGCSASGTGPELPHGPAAVSDGQALYDKYCKLCHGEAGEGYAADHANAIGKAGFLSTASDLFLAEAIDRGRPGTAMAAYGDAWGGPLAADDIKLLVVYLRSLDDTPPVDVDALLVKGDASAALPLFAETCAKCHGSKGQGKTALSLNNPMFLTTASDGYIRHAIEHGRDGTPMPAFAQRLSAAEIDNLTRLVRSWTRNVKGTPPTGEIPPTFENIVINPDGKRPEFPLRDDRFVAAADLKAALDDHARVIVLDARPTSEWLRSHIPGAIPVPYYEPDKMTGALPRDGTWIVAYCACPHAASGRVVDNLREKGFENTAVLDEGILVWTQRRYPLTFGATP